MNIARDMLINRYMIFCFFLAGLGFALLCYNYILIPQNLRINELTATRNELIQKNTNIQDFAKKNPDTNKYLAEIKRKNVLADALLPNNADIASFLIQLERIAAASGLQLCEIKPGQSIGKAGYLEVPVEVIIKGSFGQLLAFLQKLDNAERFNSVSNVSIKSHQGVLDSKLTIVIYSYSEPNGAQGQQDR